MRCVTILFVLLCALLCALPGARAAYACSCAMPPPPHEALEHTDAVFIGTVAEVVEADGAFVVRFRVDRRIKGPRGEEVTVRTASSSAACGYYFREAREYLVYAQKTDGHLHVSLCSRTARLPDAGEDLKAFGIDEGDGSDLVGASGGRCGGPNNVALLQTTFFVLVGLVVLRRRRR